MLEYLYLAKWDQSFAFLAAGSPPLYVRLLALNALFLGLYAVRKAIGAQPMGAGLTLFVQLAVLGANLLVLYQSEVEGYLLTLTRGV
jgi:hypothetical protein